VRAQDATVTAPAEPVVYRPLRAMRWVLPLVFVVFTVVAVVFLVQATRHSGPPWWFLVLWLAAFAWNAYWWSFRICTEARVGGGQLAWRTLLRRGEVPLTDVIRIRPSRTGQRQMAVVELQGRRPLVVPVRYGFERITQALQAGVPGLQVDA
jgi:hypothetical protein